MKIMVGEIITKEGIMTIMIIEKETIKKELL